jgi:adenosylcobinamide kinase/adenosylcobinamide-phosphate guanylyltransferase
MTQLPPLTLVLGGARSGKSRHAESLVAVSGANPVYIATAESRDAEMAERIMRHRARRGGAWRTVEAPLDLTAALKRDVTAETVALVDCLTLWLANLMAAERDIDDETTGLVAALRTLPASVVLVSNEVGQGIVPTNPLARRFRDHAGVLHQQIAAVADRVDFVTAGIAHRLK